MQNLGMRERKPWACSLSWHASQESIDMHRDYSTQGAITVFATMLSWDLFSYNVCSLGKFVAVVLILRGIASKSLPSLMLFLTFKDSLTLFSLTLPNLFSPAEAETLLVSNEGFFGCDLVLRRLQSSHFLKAEYEE